ncbi:MAG: SDR family oxidoreductase UcpA [Syntrophomonadaceae bacterium]|nr:SDR family oxidoreductase UcpA [Syntrophomonadaceae bacterium]MDD3889805.1 SDR family oxidoreductase UcpA [Syntrophomonadaceae bacterium]MDD4549560.1 SDR family oxidoreductase UcpA [Syntrophomonadaceae bacterium]
MFDMKDKVAIITGAAMGNGWGMAKTFGKAGAQVVMFDISDQVFESAKEFVAQGYKADAYKVDVSDFSSVKKAVDEVAKKFGKIDILVNNAGICRVVPFLELDEKMRDRHTFINIYGVWNCSKAVMPYMVEKKYGKIVNLSSVTGTMVADPGETAYAMSKAGIWGFTKALAREFAEYSINVNMICPGYILTPMAESIAKDSNAGDPASVIKGIGDAVPYENRLGTPEEVGYLAIFLASDEAAYITGQQVVIDGGSTLPETVTVG